MRPSYGAVVAWEREGGVRTPSLWSRSLQVTLGSEGVVGGEGPREMEGEVAAPIEKGRGHLGVGWPGSYVAVGASLPRAGAVWQGGDILSTQILYAKPFVLAYPWECS